MVAQVELLLQLVPLLLLLWLLWLLWPRSYQLSLLISLLQLENQKQTMKMQKSVLLNLLLLSEQMQFEVMTCRLDSETMREFKLESTFAHFNSDVKQARGGDQATRFRR